MSVETRLASVYHTQVPRSTHGRSQSCVSVVCVEVSCGRHEERLIDEIFHVRKYQKLARPVRRESEAVNVVFGLSLQQIIAVVSHSRQSDLKHSSASGFRPFLKKPPSLTFVADPQKYWRSFLFAFKILLKKTVCI